MAGIRILVTGGTFDKEYDELTGRLYFRDTHVQEMLRRGRARLELIVETAMMIDSLDMDERGRATIVERCRAAAERAIVITHGTDTMVETAAAIASALFAPRASAANEPPERGGVRGPRERRRKGGPGDEVPRTEKTIVLTGAMVPYAFGSSDGLFNLGSALSFVQVLAPGVYVAMNGRHFSWNAVRKNRDTGVFESTADPTSC
jgi:L-asparaginase